MERTLVLGAGFGGIAVATGLRAALGDEHNLVLVDRQPDFSMGLRKLWELVGMGTILEGSRPRAALAGGGTEVVLADVEAIDPVGRSAQTSSGHWEADRLVVALGAESRPDLVPGLEEHGHPIWDAAAVPRAQRALDAFGGGRIAVVIFGAPYPCPPAPYECAMLVDEHLRSRGLRERTEISVVTLQPMLLPNAGNTGSAWVAARLEERDIAWRSGAKPEGVEAGVVHLEGGDSLEFDLLLAVPPHRPPQPVVDAELAGDSGWIESDPGTLTASIPGVWALGDCTFIKLANGLPLPKAGVIAEAQGRRVAAAIAAEIRGEPEPEPFDGRGYCFLETGTAEAALVEGDFYAQPEPAVRVREARREHHDDKVAFERERLAQWFGA